MASPPVVEGGDVLEQIGPSFVSCSVAPAMHPFVLQAAVKDDLCQRFAAKAGHCQCVAHQIRRHSRLDRPADHFAVEQVEHHGQVQPAFVSPDVVDVARPDFVRRRRRKRALGCRAHSSAARPARARFADHERAVPDARAASRRRRALPCGWCG